MDPALQANIQSTLDRFPDVLRILHKYNEVVATTSRRAQSQIPLNNPSIHDWLAIHDSFQQWAVREYKAADFRLGLYDISTSSVTHPTATGEEQQEDDRWIERATNKKITKILRAMDWTLYEIGQIGRAAIEDIRVNPAPVRVKFRNPFPNASASTSSSSFSSFSSSSSFSSFSSSYSRTKSNSNSREKEKEKEKGKIPSDRTPEMAIYEAEVLRNTWLRLKSRFEFLGERYIKDLEAYSEVLKSWFESKFATIKHMNSLNLTTNKLIYTPAATPAIAPTPTPTTTTTTTTATKMSTTTTNRTNTTMRRGARAATRTATRAAVAAEARERARAEAEAEAEARERAKARKREETRARAAESPRGDFRKTKPSYRKLRF